MPLQCQKWIALIICGVALVLASGCGSLPSGPLDPRLSGNWIQRGVDTYAKFVLQQRGNAVAGTFGFYGINSSTVYIVHGTANLPNVELSWVEDTTHVTFEATLSDDERSLIPSDADGVERASFLRSP